jgi:hypothetical protein
MSVDEYERWQETNVVRADIRLLREIKSAFRAFKTRKARLYTLDELFNQPVSPG